MSDLTVFEESGNMRILQDNTVMQKEYANDR